MTAIVHEIVRASSEPDVATDESQRLYNHVADQCEGASQGADTESAWRDNAQHSPVYVERDLITVETLRSVCYLSIYKGRNDWFVCRGFERAAATLLANCDLTNRQK